MNQGKIHHIWREVRRAARLWLALILLPWLLLSASKSAAHLLTSFWTRRARACLWLSFMASFFASSMVSSGTPSNNPWAHKTIARVFPFFFSKLLSEQLTALLELPWCQFVRLSLRVQIDQRVTTTSDHHSSHQNEWRRSSAEVWSCQIHQSSWTSLDL